ncbi:hypothetical protein QEN19_003991 [Hanseniaspora menglaensis]
MSSTPSKANNITITKSLISEPLKDEESQRTRQVFFLGHHFSLRYVIYAFIFLLAISIFAVDSFMTRSRTSLSLDSPIHLSGVKFLSFFEDNIQAIDAINSKKISNKCLMQNSYYENFRFFLNTLSLETSVTQCEILTRDVFALDYVHSHNDYWRTLPLYDAIIHGVNSVEADIWLIKTKNKETYLAVGHNDKYLKPTQRNLRTLYINPLLDILDQINDNSSKLNGVFFNSPEKPLIIYIDFKDHNPNNLVAYEELLKELEPLRKYLTTTLDFEKNHYKPLVIQLTGDYPKLSNYEDYIFLDSSLISIYNRETEFRSPVVSESFNNMLKFCHGESIDGSTALRLLTKKAISLSEREIICMSEIISNAHKQNYKVRLWGVPQFPIYNRNHLWRQQLEELEVDYLNVDDLDAVTKF